MEHVVWRRSRCALAAAGANGRKCLRCAVESIWVQHQLGQRRDGRGGSLHRSFQSHLDSCVNKCPDKWVVIFRRFPVDEFSKPFLSPPLAVTFRVQGFLLKFRSQRHGLFHHGRWLFDFKLSCRQGCNAGSFAHERGFNAKPQSRQDARQTLFFFAPWHLCVFALIFSVGAGFAPTNTLAHRTDFV